jgi:hypothetical protein
MIWDTLAFDAGRRGQGFCVATLSFSPTSPSLRSGEHNAYVGCVNPKERLT